MIDEGPAQTTPAFLRSDGEMGRRIADFPWASHPLGAPEAWPQSLKTAVGLILNSQHPMWIGWGPNRSFLYNDAYLHVLGLAKHPWALGRPASDVWAEIWDVCGPLADKVFRSGEASFVDDVRLFMNRGDFLEETYYSFSYSPIRDESGEVGGLFCPSNDVTPKVVGARRLRTLSELAANALAQASARDACAAAAATLAKNPDDVPFALLYLVAGESCVLEQAVGLPAGADTLAPSPVELGGDLTMPLARCIAGVVERGVPLQITMPRTATPARGAAGLPVSDGLVLPVATGANARPLGALVVGLNPTRRLDADYRAFFDLVGSNIGTAVQSARAAEDEKRRADQLVEMDRAKTVFFSNVSHEFRTPLTLLLAPIEEIIARPPGTIPDADRELLRLARRNGLRLQRLVNALLDFSRIEAGRTEATYAPTDLAAFTADLASNFRSTCEAAGLRLVVECPPLREPVWVDRLMWEKIVLNLLSNAVKFTFAGEIVVRVALAGDQVELCVRDTGVGVPPHELPRLFERFHRVGGQRSRTHEGSGIGLALVSELVHLHGGSVTAESELERGTTIRILLPRGRNHLDPRSIADDPDDHRDRDAWTSTGTVDQYLADVLTTLDGSSSAQAPRAAAAAGGRVLLADDNRDLREYVARILSAQHEVVAVGNGRQALEVARRESFDLVITDVMMPEMDGFALLAAIRADERLHTLPVIVLSARAGEEAAVEGLERGADDYLVKPFSAAELLARVNAHVSALRSREAQLDRELRSDDWLTRPGEETISATSFRTIADQLPFIVWLQEPDGTLAFVNEEFTRVTRLPDEPQSLVPARWARCVPPEDLARLLAAIEEAVATQRAFEVELRVKACNADESAYRWYGARARPQLRDGVFHGWLGTAADIQAQKDVLDRTKQIARTLQEGLLPTRLPRTADFRVDAVYQAAEADALVGGDWFDVVHQPDGRLLLSVGDVAGHGISASVIAGRLHHAIVDFALVSDDPAAILRLTDRILQVEHPDVYATALVAFVDETCSRLVYASAGHPPPLLARHASEPAVELPLGGLPLGVMEQLELRVHTVELPKEAVLALYTDGLIEFGRDLAAAQERLCAALGQLVGRRTAERPAVAVRDAVLAGSATSDDAALLVVQFSPPVRSWHCDSRDVYATRSCRREVMAFVRRFADTADSLFEAELIVGEILANTVEHAPGDVRLELDWSGERPVLTVHDCGAGLRAARAGLPADPFSEDGRGLFLIDALSERVTIGATADGGGTQIRAVLPVRRTRG